MNSTDHPALSVDALPPPAMALACVEAGVSKAGRAATTLILLGVLAGAFIALGAMAMVTVMTGAGPMPWGIARLIGGVTFSLGLILVIVGGAELFTGDCLMITSWASRRITLGALLRAWALVYIGNLVGALGTAALAFLSAHYRLDGGLVGATVLGIANAKATLPAWPLFFLAILCNVLVCLSVWMSFSARSTTDKVMIIVPCVAAFVAAGFEHSIANAFILPYALLIKAAAGPDFWSLISQAPSQYETLNGLSSLRNVLIATAGNLLGGSVLVGGVYWLIYLRRPASPPSGAR
jgi:formate/nitrite transporter